MVLFKKTRASDPDPVFLDRCAYLPVFQPACSAAELAPVRPLGIFEAHTLFADARGDFVALSIPEFSERRILELFRGDSARLARLFPSRTGSNGFNVQAAIDTLIALAAEAGNVDPRDFGFEIRYRLQPEFPPGSEPLGVPCGPVSRSGRKSK